MPHGFIGGIEEGRKERELASQVFPSSAHESNFCLGCFELTLMILEFEVINFPFLRCKFGLAGIKITFLSAVSPGPDPTY